MAHLAKYPKGATGHMFRHYERAKAVDKETGKLEYVKFGNQDIDTSRSHLNYNLVKGNQKGIERLTERLSEVKVHNRADVNMMASWVITRPLDLPHKDQERFFEECYNFVAEKYGEENMIGAYVHLDETTPHIHISFVPVIEKENKRTKEIEQRVNAKQCISKRHLEAFHPQLSKHMEKVFGRDIGIINEATKGGNQTVKQLKAQEVHREEVEKVIKDLTIENDITIETKKVPLSRGKVIVDETQLNKVLEQANKTLDVNDVLEANTEAVKERVKALEGYKNSFLAKEQLMIEEVSLKDNELSKAQERHLQEIDAVKHQSREEIKQLQKSLSDAYETIEQKKIYADFQLESDNKVLKQQVDRLRKTDEKQKEIIKDLEEEVSVMRQAINKAIEFVVPEKVIEVVKALNHKFKLGLRTPEENLEIEMRTMGGIERERYKAEKHRENKGFLKVPSTQDDLQYDERIEFEQYQGLER